MQLDILFECWYRTQLAFDITPLPELHKDIHSNSESRYLAHSVFVTNQAFIAKEPLKARLRPIDIAWMVPR